MIVVNNTISINEIEVIPRYYSDTTTNITVIIENEDNRRVLSHSVTEVVKFDGRLSFKTNANFTENSTYYLEIKHNSIIIFRGKLFATTQSKQNYRINE